MGLVTVRGEKMFPESIIDKVFETNSSFPVK